MAPMLSTWPWDDLGSYKYLLYGPLVGKLWHARAWHGISTPVDAWCFHVLLLCLLRTQIHTAWCSFGNMLFLTRNRRIIKEGVDFKQIDKEWDWDNFIILQAFVGALIFRSFPFLGQVPLWNPKGMVLAVVLHMVVSEPLFYWVHRCLHSPYLYTHYHSLHHSSPVPQSLTAAFATPLEHILLCVAMAIPLFGASSLGYGSVGLMYVYILWFDFLRCMLHSNVEVIPSSIFQLAPFLKYIVCTPTYHTVHHTRKDCNFCLFVPLWDALGNTLSEESWTLHKRIRSAKNEDVPEFVFLAHVVDIMQAMHVPFVFRSWSSKPFTSRLFMFVMWPVTFTVMLVMWAFSKTFLISFYILRGRLHQTWAVPRFGFQYFLPPAMAGINNQIELAILRADKMGVKVLSLAALNKNESLNGGGTLFIKKHPDLKVRVVHGNTLTAAVIIDEIPSNVEEVFLTGATSKLGRAITLYLCRKKIRVLMYTLSDERFHKIQREAPAEFQQYLIQVTKYEAAQNCKVWIVGKWLSPSEQRWAPVGTHFHQFAVPPLYEFRSDCTYGKLAAMRLPTDVKGLGSCEYTLERGVVHACHAGGVVHFLEGWTHHEVGPIDVDRIDVVWEAAMRHGLRPVETRPCKSIMGTCATPT